MGNKLKVTTWNVEWLDKLFDSIDSKKQKRIDAIKKEIFDIDADVLCILEGLKGETKMDIFCLDVLDGKYVAVKAMGNDYKIQGRQWIWFLVKTELKNSASLLPTRVYDEFSCASWDVNYWGDFETTKHKHYRHPQVLVLEWQQTRLEFIGLHTKSKLVQSGKSSWDAGGEKRKTFIREAIKARIKMTTEVANVRAYINTKFEQIPNPAIIVLGDLNDGPARNSLKNNISFLTYCQTYRGMSLRRNAF